MRNYQLILFDVDGTIHDSFLSITKTFQRTVRELCGIEEPDLEVFRRFIGPPLVDSLALYGLEGDALQTAVDFYRTYYQTTLDDTVVYPGIPDLLQALHNAGKTLAVASSKLEALIKDLLRGDGLLQYFDFIGGLIQEGVRETKTEVIGRVLREYKDVPREQVVMIGDRHYDAQGAQDNGIDFIAAGYGPGTREEFAAFPMVYYAQSAQEIQQFLLDENG